MLKKISRLTTSLMSLLEDSSSNTKYVSGNVDLARKSMLYSLRMLVLPGESLPELWEKILYAPTAQTLWYLRVDLMALMSEKRGEAWANDHINEISKNFTGLVQSNQLKRKRLTSDCSSV